MSKRILLVLVAVLTFTLSGCNSEYDKGIVDLEEFEIVSIDVNEGSKLNYHLEIPYSDNERAMLVKVDEVIFKYEYYTNQRDDGSIALESDTIIKIIDDEDTEIKIYTVTVTTADVEDVITVLLIDEEAYFTDEALYNELDELLVY